MIELEWNDDGDAVIKLTGNLDWVAATALRHVVHDLLQLGANFVIDLRSTSGVDATGASALVGATRRARALGPSVSIVNPRPSVRRQLELMRIDQLILFPNVDSGGDASSS
jgi:stage II sporulation protein AA (anti-sigma F factor antagonist)